MEKKRSARIVLLGILAGFLLVTNSYCEEQLKHEQEFKRIVKEMNDIVSKNVELFMKALLDEAYIKASNKKMQKELASYEPLINDLKGFILKYSDTKYTDDAAYLLISLTIPTVKSEEYVQELKLFLEKHPNASLEDWTVNNYAPETLALVNEMGVINAVKMDIFTALYQIKRYEESIVKAREFIDNFENLTEKNRRFLGKGYYYLMTSYEALGNNKKVREVCKEAIKKLPDYKGKETFIQKLKELDSAPE